MVRERVTLVYTLQNLSVNTPQTPHHGHHISQRTTWARTTRTVYPRLAPCSWPIHASSTVTVNTLPKGAERGPTPCTDDDGAPAVRYGGGEEVELGVLRSFNFGDHDGGAARETSGAVTIDPFDGW